jgi:hypothetical protein
MRYVANAYCPDDIAARFRAALLDFSDAVECATLRDRLALANFVPVSLTDYELIPDGSREVEAAGYDRPF